MKKMNKKGFTLVEIMIVVAIIGLLAAIGIPSFQRARANSIARTMDNNARIIDSAVEQWAMENGYTDGTAVTTAVTNFIKGGLAALSVGNTNAANSVAEAEITALTVGQDISASDFYTVPQ